MVATGLRLVLPDGIEAGPRVFHNHGLLGSLDRLPSMPHGGSSSRAPGRARQRLPTNYAAVDVELIDDLYRREYDERLRGLRQLFVHHVTEIEGLCEGPGGVSVTLCDLGDRARRRDSRGRGRRTQISPGDGS